MSQLENLGAVLDTKQCLMLVRLTCCVIELRKGNTKHLLWDLLNSKIRKAEGSPLTSFLKAPKEKHMQIEKVSEGHLSNIKRKKPVEQVCYFVDVPGSFEVTEELS